MESIGSPEEEVKLNTPLPAPHIIPFYYSSPTFFPQVSNPAAEEAKENVSGEGEGTEEARKFVVSEKYGNNPALYGEVIMDSVGIPEEEVNFNYNTSLDACRVPPTLEVVKYVL